MKVCTICLLSLFLTLGVFDVSGRYLLVDVNDDDDVVGLPREPVAFPPKPLPGPPRKCKTLADCESGEKCLYSPMIENKICLPDWIPGTKQGAIKSSARGLCDFIPVFVKCYVCDCPSWPIIGGK